MAFKEPSEDLQIPLRPSKCLDKVFQMPRKILYKALYGALKGCFGLGATEVHNQVLEIGERLQA
jgi:hypothetical protein